METVPQAGYSLGRDPAQACLRALEAAGFDFFSGVACSLLSSLLVHLSRTEPPRYFSAVREDSAIGLAAGAYLGGAWPCVLMQNSGIGYCLNALTSLNLIYRIPTLLVVGYRGYQGKDAPEHEVMGRSCEALLREVGIPVWVPEGAALETAIQEASTWLRRQKTPAALFIRPGVL